MENQPNQNFEYEGNQDEFENESGSGEEDADGVRQGGKRRSKNDNQGRDFKCKYCDKTYLSYPALYTHMKQKHSKGPDGELRNPPTSGRGRGRPRKNPYQRLDPRTEDFFKAPEREGGPVDPLCCFQEVYTTIFSFSQQVEPEQLKKNMQEYPIFKYLIQFSNMVDDKGIFIAEPANTGPGLGMPPGLKNKAGSDNDEEESEGNGSKYEGGDSQNGDQQPNGVPPSNGQQVKTIGGEPQMGENPGSSNQFPPYQQQQSADMQNDYKLKIPVTTLPPSANPQKWQRNYDNLSPGDRTDMLVDEIFALYLYRMSNRINQYYYKIVLAYVIFFRECLNEYGWGKKIESEGIRLDNNPDLKKDIETKQFCLVNNAEHAPEICNEFVTVYMEYKKNIYDIPKHDQVDLTINLCHWLFQCQFTCSKLTMIA